MHCPTRGAGQEQGRAALRWEGHGYRLRGGDGSLGSSIHPPTHIRDFVLMKNEFYERDPKLKVDFRYTNFFFGL